MHFSFYKCGFRTHWGFRSMKEGENSRPKDSLESLNTQQQWGQVVSWPHVTPRFNKGGFQSTPHPPPLKYHQWPARILRFTPPSPGCFDVGTCEFLSHCLDSLIRHSFKKVLFKYRSGFGCCFFFNHRANEYQWALGRWNEILFTI